MKNKIILLLFLGIFLISNVSAAVFTMYQEGNGVALNYKSFPATCQRDLEQKLANYGLSYAGGKITGSFTLDENYNLYIGDYTYKFDNLKAEISGLREHYYNNNRKADGDYAGELYSALDKFGALAMENIYKGETGFTITILSFDGAYGRFQSGAISCSGRCYLGKAISDKDWYSLSIKDGKITFKSINERTIALNSANSQFTSYQAREVPFALVIRGGSGELTYYIKKQDKGMTFYDAVRGASYTVNGKSGNNLYTEMFTLKTGCAIPSTTNADGVAIVEHKTTIDSKDYFSMTIPNYYCQEELPGVSFSVPDFPISNEINNLASLIANFLGGETTTAPEIKYRSTEIKSTSERVKAELCQTKEECKSFIA